MSIFESSRQRPAAIFSSLRIPPRPLSLQMLRLTDFCYYFRMFIAYCHRVKTLVHCS